MELRIAATRGIIDWVGQKAMHALSGTIAAKESSLTFNHDKNTGGTFVTETVNSTGPAANSQLPAQEASYHFFATIENRCCAINAFDEPFQSIY